MALGTLLLERNLLQPHELDAAREHQKIARCSLIASVLALDLLSREELNAVLGEAPPSPETIDETGLDLRLLLGHVLKTMLMEGSETPTEIARTVCLPEQVITDVLADAKEKRLVEVLGLADARRSIYRYALTDLGTSWASDSLDQCHYVGPAPVRLDAYRSQASRQTISRDTAGPESMARALSHLVLPQGLVDQLGPATNSGKTILLYGAAGNGKTSIAEALGRTFEQPIYIPHCFEVGGQIVRFFDPAVHEPWEELNLADEPADGADFDRRWVKCKRPVIITGGELTIEMLDLSFDPVSKFYEAPAHLKANGGVFIIDDFGRQRVRSTDLLNRWILPLERRVDLLTLHTGKKVEVPFDELVIFSTNFPPGELLDEAGLRRVPYKFMIDSPNRDQYASILGRVCEAHRLHVGEGVLEYLLDVFYPETGLPVSGAHPGFVVDHVLERCRFHGAEPLLSPELVREAVSHLLVEGSAPPVYYRP